MKWTEDHTRLQEELASIYVDKDTAVQLATVAGVDTKYIKFSDQASKNWYEIVRAAQNQGKLVPLLEQILKEHPTNVVIKAFLDDLKAGKIIRESTPEQSRRNRRSIYALIGTGLMVVTVVVAVLVANLINTQKLKKQIQVAISIQPYDLIKGRTNASVIELPPIEGDVDHVGDIALSAANQISSKIQPNLDPAVDLEIIENELHASAPLIAEITYFQNVTQTRGKRMEFGGSNFLKLDEFFQGLELYNPVCNCIGLTVGDSAGLFSPEFIQIFKNVEGFSFDSESMVSVKPMNFDVGDIIILFAPTEPSGTNDVLENTLRQELLKLNFIKFSQLSLDELEKKREELLPMEPSGIKQEIIEQFDIDFLISMNINRKNP